MEGKNARDGARNALDRRAVDCVRKRSLHRIWWSSARVALKRGHSGEPPASESLRVPPPSGVNVTSRVLEKGGISLEPPRPQVMTRRRGRSTST